MIPRIAKGGHSFKGAYQYFFHDKGQSTQERVIWTQTENMLTDDPELAWKVMAYTALEQSRLKEASGQKATGRKLQKPVFSYSLAWHPEQNPDQEHMLDTARKSLAALDLTDYETLIVAHRDEPQKHVHIIVNRVHPLTGIAASLSNTKQKLSDFAHAYEQESGKIYCQQREQNREQHKEGKKTRYTDPNIQKAWDEAADGKSFAEALKKRGYQLAQGDKRMVVVDPHGKIHNPLRHLKGVRAKDLKEKLVDEKISPLFDAAGLSGQIRKREKQEYQDRQKKPGSLTKEFSPKRDGSSSEPSPAAINRLQDGQIEERAKLFNRHYERIEKEHEELDEFYHIKDQKHEVEALKDKVAHESWWRRLFGFARRDREQLESKQKSLEDAQELIIKRLEFLEHERERAMLKLAEKHAQERESLHDRETGTIRPKPVRHIVKKKERGFDFDR
jgi:hypothetical protein